MKTSVTKQLQALEWKWHDTEQHSQRKEQIHRKFSSRRGHLRCGLDQWDSPDWITWAGIPENTFVVVCRSGEDILIRGERSSLPECFCLNKLNKNKKQFSLCAPLNYLISVWINELSDSVTVFDSNVSLMHHNYKNTISSVDGVNEQSRGRRGGTLQRMKFPLVTRRRHYSNKDSQEPPQRAPTKPEPLEAIQKQAALIRLLHLK